ncbi:unnamed protein product [Cochlearia groenlandica]
MWILKWFLLLLLHLLLLTQHNVDSASVVRYLPGFEGPLPFHLETGYIGVGEEEENKLFYYFIKSEKNPKEDPLIIWLSGGPGCSALSSLVFEIGPLTIKTEGYNGGLPSLVSTSYSWTKEASIIFLDQPVGSGFSYTTNPYGDKPSDIGEAKQTYEFLQKWLVENPEFLSNPFYVCGDSYSGLIVPAIVQHISIGFVSSFSTFGFYYFANFIVLFTIYSYAGNEHGHKPLINLKGYVLGNPVTNVDQAHNFRIPFCHGMGMISDELYVMLKRSCNGSYVNIDPTNTQCLKSMEEYNKCVSGIFIVLILLPNCPLPSPNPSLKENIGRRLLDSRLSLPSHECYTYRYVLATKWANDQDVHRALHVVKGSIKKWVRCADQPAYVNNIENSVPYHRNISNKGIYRSLIYNGDHDLVVPFLATQAWIRYLNYSIIDQWRPWFISNQAIGFTRTYANNMTFTTIKARGHTAEYKPNESFVMFKRWIHGQFL